MPPWNESQVRAGSPGHRSARRRALGMVPRWGLVALGLVPLGHLGCGSDSGSIMPASESEPTCGASKCDSTLADVSLTFSEKLTGRFRPGDADSSPAHLDALDADSGVACEISAVHAIDSVAGFLADRNHTAKLSGEIRIARLGGNEGVVAGIEDGSTFDYLRVNPATGVRETRYLIRFSHQDVRYVLRADRQLRRDTAKDKSIDDFRSLIPEVVKDATVAYGTLAKEEPGGDLGSLRIVSVGDMRSWDDLVDVARFFLKMEARGGSAIGRLLARTTLLAFTTGILTDEYFPSVTNPIGIDRVGLEAALTQPSSAEICQTRDDESCQALRAIDASPPEHTAARVAELANIISRRLQGGGRSEALRDPVVHYFLRERGPALFAYNHLTQFGERQVADYSAEATRLLSTHYPAYPAAAFALARPKRPPAPTPASCSKREALILSPGLFRATGGEELREVFEALQRYFPCLEVVRADPATYATTRDAARTFYEAAMSVDASLPLHLVAHSAGANRVLEALVEHPDLAARTRTVVSLQPTAHGTAVAGLLDTVLHGIPGEAVADLTPEAGASFWASQGSKLPTDVLYLTLRAVAIYPEENIPTSNRINYRYLRSVDGVRIPYNDMQALLTAQYLGGPVGDVEVLSKVVEGNHYQWGLARGDCPNWVMPPEMSDRIPRAAYFLGYYQALHEVGLFLPDPPR